MGLKIFLFLAITLLSTCLAEPGADNGIRQPRYNRNSTKINCKSFRLGVEANNLRGWETVPSYCGSYTETYVTRFQYDDDLEAMVNSAVDLAHFEASLRDGFIKYWVFDLDDTLISSLGFISKYTDYGTQPLNKTAYYQWIKSLDYVPEAVPTIKTLYDTLLSLGFRIFIISDAPASLEDLRVVHLRKTGFTGYEALAFRAEDESDLSNREFKTKKLRELLSTAQPPTKVVASVGDQWSDLTIPHAGNRVFKVPNPFYYVA